MFLPVVYIGLLTCFG